MRLHNILEKNINEKNLIQKNNKNKIDNLSTKGTTLEGKNINDFSNRNNLISYLNNNNSSFFENFDLLEYINSGSSGHVYKGLYKGQIKRQVAIKFLINNKRKEKQEEKENIKKESKNNQEIAISKKLHHKNITEIYAYFKTENIDYSVLEYGKYGDIEFFLKKLLKRNALSETSLNYLGKQILDGLQYIHRCKVAHLDIKPSNILIDSNLNCKITDFSVSCPYSSFNPEDLVKFPVVGTRKFMAPEILSKEHMKIKETEKIDIYSFGVSLYYLFYGEYPYKLREVKGKDYNDILNKIKDEELTFPEKRKISNLFKDFFEKTLEKDYKKRLSIKQALEHPWIKGSQIIFDEKENTYCQESFLIRLITDNIPKFNEYIR
jgi:polo-like kinase 1